MKEKHKNNLSCKGKGNITVEASFLFPIVFIIIIMLVFLMLFYYNKITIWKNTYYIGIKLVDAKREETEYDLETEWYRISNDTLIYPENLKVSIKENVEKIIVTGEMQFNIPFWGKVDIQEKSMVSLCSSREIMARNRLWENR